MTSGFRINVDTAALVIIVLNNVHINVYLCVVFVVRRPTDFVMSLIYIGPMYADFNTNTGTYTNTQ